MKKSSIASPRAIALSLLILLNSGFLAMAADGSDLPTTTGRPAPPSPPANIGPAPDIKSQIDNPPVNPEAKAAATDMAADKEPDPDMPEGAKLLDTGEVPNDIVRADDEQIPVAVIVNGITRTEGIAVFLPTGYSQEDVLVPIGALSDLLSFAIKANPGDKKAEGFFINEQNTFQLDANTNEVQVAGKRMPLKAGEVEVRDDDIYAKASSLSKWFGINFSLDMSQLALVIKSKGDLPFQDELRREERNKTFGKTYVFDAVKPENSTLAPYRNFSLPSLYLTNSLGYQKNESAKGFLGISTLQGNQDIAKFETDYTLSGRMDTANNQNDITGARILFQRRDPTKSLLGPLHAGKVAFGDISYPSVPLFLGGGRGAGAAISSDSRLGFRYANNSENFILDGDAPVGYDAELYNNGSFIAFQKVGADGRFLFENLVLTTGYNHFEVILYGPQGQKTSIVRDILRGARMLKKGELQYDAAAGTPRRDFIPISTTAEKDSTVGASGQVFYGFTNFFTVGASAYTGPENIYRDSSKVFASENQNNLSLLDDPNFANTDHEITTRSTGGAVSAALSFLGMNLQQQALIADKSRSAYETSLSARPFGYNLGLTHTTYKNFLDTGNDQLRTQNELSLSNSFGKFNTTFLVKDRDFVTRPDDIVLENILSFNFFNFNISNDIVKTISNSEQYDDLEGELAALTDFRDIRLRGALIYDLDPEAPERLRSVSFSGQKNLTGRSTIRFEGQHQFDSGVDNLGVRYSKDFDKFGLDFDALAGTDNSFAFTVGMRVALQPEQKGHYTLVDPRSGGLAALGARAFIDGNGNGIYDDGEKIVEGVSFKASTSADVTPSDKDGVAYITNLGEAPVRISVDDESIPDIYLAPEFDHRDLIPRRGSTPIIDFPFVKMSEIAGYLTHLKQGVEGIMVKLINGKDGKEVESTETDGDGYFIFPAVKGGSYKIAFGLPKKDDFMSLNIVLDTSIEDPPEMKIEASDELVQAAKEAAQVKPAAAETTDEGAAPNIDDPLNEKDLKPLDEKGVEGIITQ